MNLKFSLLKKSGPARLGSVEIRGQRFETPVFMPVATRGTVRNQRWSSINHLSPPVLLANTYHLMRHPGPEVFQEMGGIHPWMNWKGLVLTDSGGFQIFSLPGMRTLSADGALFEPEGEGRRYLLTPERSFEIQTAINSDIRMVLDVCIPSTSERALALQAMEQTHVWAERSVAFKAKQTPDGSALFGIVQGACDEGLRRQSAEFLRELPFDGLAIGGLAVGETKLERERMTELTTAYLPEQKPRYLMGVGTPIDLLEGVSRGVDMFDCVLPTMLAQRGVAYTSQGRKDLRRGVYSRSKLPLDPDCRCEACITHTEAYLHHLLKCEEPLLWNLVGEHNLTFYTTLMARIREAIREDRFQAFYAEWQQRLSEKDIANPVKTQAPSPAKKRVMEIGNFEICESPHPVSREPVMSIREKLNGEIIHAKFHPMEESRGLYILNTNLGVRLQEETATGDKKTPFIIWDVGLGTGANALAAIETAERLAEELSQSKVRPLSMVSFETDLDVFKLAIQNRDHFDFLKHPAPEALLHQKKWKSKEGAVIDWTLFHAGFWETMEEAPLPDLIFFDLFSMDNHPELWALEKWNRLFNRLSQNQKDTEIVTYSSATQTRAVLLAAGFHLADIPSTHPERNATLAATPNAFHLRAERRKWLDTEWLGRWERSNRRIPGNTIDQLVLNHPQFKTR